ncbi:MULTISPECIES: hypothetical protein [unclassified Pseudomonas]|uniref:hypothetical protein n=1 Tax=unclassified Pseudomonas TaxID=196821 RepID=UPI00244C24F1|nr:MULTISPECIES: hypothetical protein [unclassified Pseudomonas]MDH0893618.1 hypothetical protein [Pseudomonas sp. GD03875]MDH1065731.1 hypothetical protein [Pseudomonas sp. GD03985]
MPTQRFALPFLLICALLVGCAPSDPQAELEATVQRLQDELEAKRSDEVLDLLHPQFSARQEFDRDWARRTMALLFLRHKQVRVIAIGTRSELDPTYSDRGHTRAEVALTGAEGLIPDSARHYSVKLEWWREGDEWKLARLDWE